MTTFVVCRDGHIDEFGWGVSITKGDDRDIDVGSFLDSLGVGARVGHYDETGFLERASDVVGEIAWCEASGDSDGTGMSSELEYSTLTIGTSGDDGDISWVVDCGDDASCEDDFFPISRLN